MRDTCTYVCVCACMQMCVRVWCVYVCVSVGVEWGRWRVFAQDREQSPGSADLQHSLHSIPHRPVLPSTLFFSSVGSPPHVLCMPSSACVCVQQACGCLRVYIFLYMPSGVFVYANMSICGARVYLRVDTCVFVCVCVCLCQPNCVCLCVCVCVNWCAYMYESFYAFVCMLCT